MRAGRGAAGRRDRAGRGPLRRRRGRRSTRPPTPAGRPPRRPPRAAARVEALQLALDAARARAGAERLADVDGVLGTLLDLVRIDAGWEAAVEAALGEALLAPSSSPIRPPPAGRSHALRTLRHQRRRARPRAAARRAPARRRRPSGDAVRPHVRADRVAVDALLDACSPRRRASTAVDDAVERRRRRPRRRRRHRATATASAPPAGASAPPPAAPPRPRSTRPSAAAARAARRRRPADGRADRRGRASCAAARRHRDELQPPPRRQRRPAHDGVGGAGPRPGRAPRGRRRAGAARRARVAELAEHLAADAARIAELERCVPDLEADEPAEADAARDRAEARAGLDARAALLAGRRRDLEVRAAGLRRAAAVPRSDRLDETERRLAADAEARARGRRSAAPRSSGRSPRSTGVGRLVDAPSRRRRRPPRRAACEQRRRQSDQVRALSPRLDDAARPTRTAAERTLDEVRERARRAEIDEAEARLRLESAVEMLRHDLDVEPDAAEAAELPPLPEGVSAPARVRELERELRLLGPINPLALEEFTELQQRHTFLEEQLEDVRTTRRELARVIKAVDLEIQTVFAAAFADVSAQLHGSCSRRCSPAAPAGSS